MLCNPLKTHTVVLRASNQELGHFDATFQQDHVSVWVSPDIVRHHKEISVEVGGKVLVCLSTKQIKCNRSIYLWPDCIEMPLPHQTH
ncbi:hypothetical protein [Salinimonas chungwhensis]|uniref:hypothetical protein n=1 Tax=Salinimonas chungwhensis TaxID=265425 RepID=UPI00037B1B08|nr:hypothetical protein [Salinimonas chungwhensis]